MNRRQKMKRLKKELVRVKGDNRIMRDIIKDSPRMEELYYLYNRPVNVTTTTMMFEQFKGKRFLPPDNPHNAMFTELYKHELEREMFETIKNYIEFEIHDKDMYPSIEGSIYIGIKKEDAIKALHRADLLISTSNYGKDWADSFEVEINSLTAYSIPDLAIEQLKWERDYAKEQYSADIEKIRAEIREEYDPTTEGRSVDDTYDSFHFGLRFCLEIIDKHIGGKAE